MDMFQAYFKVLWTSDWNHNYYILVYKVGYFLFCMKQQKDPIGACVITGRCHYKNAYINYALCS
jgi:hypothetical protein